MRQFIDCCVDHRHSPRNECASRSRPARGCTSNAHRTHVKIIMVLEEIGARDDHFRRVWVDVRQVFADRAAARIEHLQRGGLADPRLVPATTALALDGMVEHFAHVWLALDQPFDEDHVVETLTRLWAQAIGLEVPDAV